MAKSKNDISLSRNVLRSLWQHIGTANWEQLLKEYKRPHGFVRMGADKLRGLCLDPNHHDTSPSFYIDVERGFAKCYGSSCGFYESDPIRLLSLIMGTSLGDTVKYVVNTFKPPALSVRAADKFEKYHKHQEMKAQIFHASQQLTLQALQSPAQRESEWATPALKWLVEQRRIPSESIYALPVAVMPPMELLQNVMIHMYGMAKDQWLSDPPITRGTEPCDYSVDATKYLASAYKSGVMGAVMFPQCATPREISRFKLRTPDVCQGDDKRIYIVDDDHDETVGLYGLNWGPYNTFFTSVTPQREVIITEGEFDVMSIMAQWVHRTTEPVIPVLSAGGVGSAKDIEDALTSIGVTQAYFIGDAPDKAGDGVVQTWLRYMKKIPVRVFTGWDRLAPAKDLDDAINVRDLGLGSVIDAIHTRRTDTYTASWAWLVEQVTPKLHETSKDDIRCKIEIIAEYSNMLRNHIERKAFTDAVAAEFNLNANLVYRESTTKNDTPAGFIQRVVNALTDELFVVGTDPGDGSRKLILYHKTRKTIHPVTIDSERSIVQELAPITGLLTQYVDECIGWPPFLDRADEATDPLTYKRNDEAIRSYFKNAVLQMSRGTIDMTKGEVYRQGFFRITRQDGEVLEALVCGTDIFRVIRDEEGNTEYEPLEGPLYKDVVFDVGRALSQDTVPWYPGGITVEKLNRNRKFNIAALYQDLYKIMFGAFSFKDHDLTSKLMAANIMCFPICDVFYRSIVLLLQGDSSSGKTSLTSLFSPHGYQELRLLYASQGNDGYTAAATARLMDGDKRVMVLDEFESSEDSKAPQVNAILGMIRGLVNGQGSREICLVGGGTKRQHFRLPVVMSGIQGADKIQDLNRATMVYTVRKAFFVNPEDSIRKIISPERKDEIIEQLNLGMFSYAEELRVISEEIRHSFSPLCNKYKLQAEERWFTGIVPALAVMKLVGEDWEAFFRDYVLANEYTIKRVSATTESQAALAGIMHNPCISQTDGPHLSLAQLLVMPEKRAEINTAGKGIFYDSESKYLLFLAPTIYAMLPQHLRKTLASQHHVRTVIERHDTAISPQLIEESGILKRIVRYLGANIKLTDVIVVDAYNWLQSATDAQITTPKDKVQNGKAKVDGIAPAAVTPGPSRAAGAAEAVGVSWGGGYDDEEGPA